MCKTLGRLGRINSSKLNSTGRTERRYDSYSSIRGNLQKNSGPLVARPGCQGYRVSRCRVQWVQGVTVPGTVWYSVLQCRVQCGTVYSTVYSGVQWPVQWYSGVQWSSTVYSGPSTPLPSTGTPPPYPLPVHHTHYPGTPTTDTPRSVHPCPSCPGSMTHVSLSGMSVLPKGVTKRAREISCFCIFGHP